MFSKIPQQPGLKAAASGNNSRNDNNFQGNYNNVVNITVQGGGTAPLTLQPTRWNDKPQDLGWVAALLEWRTRLAPLIGREAELASLNTWLNGDAELSFMVLHADGGSGKTRLAAEFAELCKGWQHGWVDLRDFTKADAMVWQGRNLLLVDYAEHQPEQLARMARAAQRVNPEGGGKLRVLLVVRQLEPVRDVLQRSGCSGLMAAPIKLGELTREQDFEVLHAALAKLEQMGKHSGAAGDVTADRFKDWQLTNPLHCNPLFVTALAIDLTTESTEPGNPPKHNWLTGSELLQSLVKRECHRWELAEKGHRAPPGAIQTVVVWATLSNGITAAQLNDDLMEAYKWTAEQQRGLHQALAAAWPSQNNQIPSLAPDLLAAQFLTHWRSSAGAQGHAKRDAALAEKLWQISDKASFQPKFERLHMLAYDQAMRIESCKLDSDLALQIWLLGLAGQLNAFADALLKASVEKTWPAFIGLVSDLGRDTVSGLEDTLSPDHRAKLLNDQSIRLSLKGDREGAFIHAQQAVNTYHFLAKANPAVYGPDLAMSLNNLASFSSNLGDHQGALAFALDSLSIRRRLAYADPAANERGLAASLNNLAGFVSTLGDHQEGLALASEAVSIYRRLALASPADYEPDLARSLNNLANRMGGVGDRQGALVIASEAVIICRRLAQGNPALCEADLAGSLNNLAGFIKNSGDPKEALVPALDAVNIRRRLARANPASYEPDLAMSLGMAMGCFIAAGEKEKAKAYGEDALALYTKLSVAQSKVFERHKEAVQTKLAGL